MSKWKIEFNPEFKETPLTFWVHKHLDDMPCNKLDPPLPKPIPCKGYPLLKIDAFGYELIFSSIAEVEHFISIIGQKNLPTTQQLSAKRNSGIGPNSHWLSRLPSSLKPWIKREKIIAIINKSLIDFKCAAKVDN